MMCLTISEISQMTEKESAHPLAGGTDKVEDIVEVENAKQKENSEVKIEIKFSN